VVTAVSDGLGEFLRAHRARCDPGDAGLSGGGHRRVAGLRREEVAVLAGVSADYYARLEQGRERNPSAQVLNALASVFKLDADGRGHLFRLAGVDPRAAPNRDRDIVHPSLLQLLDAFPISAAYVLSPSFLVLAANPVAVALLSPFDGMRDMVRLLFTHPRAKTVFTDWPQLVVQVVHALRLNAGRFPDDPAIRGVVDELMGSSPEFRALWEDHQVGRLVRMTKVFVHPEAGRIELQYQTFEVHDAPGQQLLVGTAQPGTRDAQAMAYLAAMQTHEHPR
jgi:transcriptional regulator with XRE-family HTH domain